MGLAFRHSKARWTYSGFMRFRKRLAKEIGLNLALMDGFCEDGGASWDLIKDPIMPLLNHLDSEGSLSARACATIGPRLRELVAPWEHGYDKLQGLILAEDMIRCAQKGWRLDFL